MHLFLTVLAWLAGLTLLGIGLYRIQRGGAARQCPHCRALSRTIDFGRFLCAGCDRAFVLTYRGRPSQSLISALWPPLAVWALVVGGYFTWILRQQDRTLLPLAPLVVLLTLNAVGKAVWQKRFAPNPATPPKQAEHRLSE